MTAPARARQDPALIARATQLAAAALTRNTKGKAPLPATAAAFGRALARTQPRSAHGQLLSRALQPRPWAKRSPAEQACHWLARRGETPTETAVAKRVAAVEELQQRGQERRKAVERIVADDGPRAAAHVTGVIAATGAGPTWRELGGALGWPEWSWPAAIGKLERAGWLMTGSEPRSLRPGPRCEAAPEGAR